MRWALYVTLAPAWFDPGESVVGVLTPFWVLYALHDALVKPMPGQRYAASLAESWTVERGSTRLQLHAASRFEIPQRRSVHRRGREVQLHAGEGGAAAPEGEGGRGRRPDSCAVRAARALAGLHDILRHVRQRRWLDRAEELCGEGRRRRIQAAPGGPWSVQVRQQQAGHRTGDGGVRGLLAQGALR